MLGGMDEIESAVEQAEAPSLAPQPVVGEPCARCGQPLPPGARFCPNCGAPVSPVTTEERQSVPVILVDLAARLQSAAAPEEILVGETTWQLTRDSVEYAEPRTVAAAGFGRDVLAWPVVSLSPRSTRRTIPLVDRRRELTLIEDTFERA